LSTDRPAPRADAARNRERILAAAARLFAEGDAGPEAVAREAGVGVGTLYRNFPSREALAAAVYRDELDRLADAATGLLDGLDPLAALREWADLFRLRLERKRQMGDAMRALAANGDVTAEGSRARLAVAADRILAAGVEAGEFRADARGDDLVVALVGIRLACPLPEQEGQAARLTELVIAGLLASPGPAQTDGTAEAPRREHGRHSA
jgi:AcrR family transcriptional regulator